MTLCGRDADDVVLGAEFGPVAQQPPGEQGPSGQRPAASGTATSRPMVEVNVNARSRTARSSLAVGMKSCACAAGTAPVYGRVRCQSRRSKVDGSEVAGLDVAQQPASCSGCVESVRSIWFGGSAERLPS